VHIIEIYKKFKVQGSKFKVQGSKFKVAARRNKYKLFSGIRCWSDALGHGQTLELLFLLRSMFVEA